MLDDQPSRSNQCSQFDLPGQSGQTDEFAQFDQLHVAPWGRDSWPGTHDRPFATLPAAQRAVRARTASLHADLVVNLHAGTYFLDAPLTLDGAAGDSGENGHRVVYQAYGHGSPRQEKVVVSGGRVITGWTPGEVDGAWQAEVGSLETRQLYVNGRRAPRASLSPGIPGSVTKTETGYVTDSTAPQSWQDPTGIEFVFPWVYPWSEARCRVAEITGDARSTTITLAQPAFDRARELYAATWVGEKPESPESAESPESHRDARWDGLARPSSAENSVSFLTEPGTFVLDRSAPGRHVLHYLPLPGEDMAKAEIVAPVLEKLVVGRGTEEHPLHDVTLRGLTFSHAGWTEPDGPHGFLHFFANSYYGGGELQKVELADGNAHVTIPAAPRYVPANVEFTAAVRVALHDNTFTGLGAGAIGFTGPGRDNTIVGNRIEDVSGSAVTVTSGTGTRIQQNLIRHIGREYHGSPALWVSDAREVTVAHNEIHDVPYSGIVVTGGSQAARVQVIENLIHHTMTMLADGGGIYLNGPQGTSYADGTLVRGNVVRDTLTPYNFGLYTDYGAAWVTVQANVVHRSDAPIVLRVTPPLENVTFLDNFWDDHPADADTPPSGVTLAGNKVLPKDGFEKALAADPAGAAILASAGRSTPSVGPNPDQAV
ncbi:MULTISPECIES: right-handed parallel beta-helix repeat-containing protein [unclassified Streptomyces]|uniref:right-handed parallel beta-helix repeat-containing protein n=1 Tax=unclassified Streptomyces TaxID=2593676 RepID=UPI0003695336|nr:MULTISPECIES: right-handed parallel beta-helix repeat-containing protein [unclassified Streptomyces]MYT33713.1 right-handed parallel beta-helix repeat-containing protein [Streptomyces sp. SID8354]